MALIEAAIEKLSANDKARADRICRQSNDEYAYPTHTLRTRILFHKLASRQAAFWRLAMQHAEPYLVMQADLVDNTTY